MPKQLDILIATSHPPFVDPGLAASATPDGLERRAEARYPAQDPAEIEIISGLSERIYGTVLDVSRSGMRIAVPKRMNRGEQVKVKLINNIVFGEVRYCRSVSGVFQAGIRIQELTRPAARENRHIEEDPLSLYAVGKGLTVEEVIEVREHLVRCEICRARLTEKEKCLKGPRRSSLRRLVPSED